jgi:PAS domain S-box-containing protein
MVKARGLKRLEGEEQPPRYEIRIVAKDGTEKWLDLSSTVSRIHNKNTTVASAFDITERKRAEQSLRESRQQLMDIINFFPDATVVVDREEKIIAWNRAAELLTGVKKEDMLGKGNREYSIPFYGDRRPALIDLALHPDPAAEARFTSIRRTGDIIFGEAYTPNIPPGDVHMSAKASVLRDSRGEIVAAIECLRNNTERRHMEERLARAEKMEALGTLAGGVAHDLNNVLGVLVGYSELLAEKAPRGYFHPEVRREHPHLQHQGGSHHPGSPDTGPAGRTHLGGDRPEPGRLRTTCRPRNSRSCCRSTGGWSSGPSWLKTCSTSRDRRSTCPRRS